MSKSIQIKVDTNRQETALTVALEIHINSSIKHQTLADSEQSIQYTKTQTAKIR